MATYDIRVNPRNAGLYTFFEHDGNQFYADVCAIWGSKEYLGFENECMIFSAKDKEIGRSLYCKRNIPVTEEALVECIEDFIKLYDTGEELRDDYR